VKRPAVFLLSHSLNRCWADNPSFRGADYFQREVRLSRKRAGLLA